MSILSLPTELICYIVEEFLDEPADIFSLLRGSNRLLAPALTTILNSYAIRYENALNSTLWAAFYQQRDLLSLLIKEGDGIWICHPPYLPSNVAHEELLDYAMDNSRSLRVRNCPYDDCTMLEWALSSVPRLRLERVEEILKSGVRYGAEAFAGIKWGQSYYDCNEDDRDKLNSATLDLLLEYLPDGRLNEILLDLYNRGIIPILEASGAGHYRVVELFLQNGVSSDVSDEAGGLAPLHLAARFGHVAAVGILLDFGADIGQRDLESRTPLHHATSMKQRDVVQLLVLSGAPTDHIDEMGNTPLTLAVETSDHTIVETLILHGADPNGQTHDGADSYPRGQPLHIAVELGYPTVVEVLVHLGADIEAPSTGGTPLMIAVSMGYDEIVRLLIKNRANMYPINHMGTSLMHTAASEGHEKTVVTLAERMSAGCINSRDHWGDTPMHVAASNGHVAVLKALFHLGANVNSIRKDGSSPLSLAVAIGSPATVSTLLDLGAQVRPLDGRAALKSKNIQVICQIMDRIESQPIPGFLSRGVLQSELVFAAEYGHEGWAKHLLKRGADPTMRDGKGSTPLNRALRNRCLATARLLIDHAKNVNKFDDQGNTPLYLAIKHHHSCDLIKKLLSKGANPNIWNSQGSTPFHLAAESTRALILIPLLVKESCNINLNSRDGSGRTVLHIVSEDPVMKKRLYQYLINKGAANWVRDSKGNFASYYTPDVLGKL